MDASRYSKNDHPQSPPRTCLECLRSSQRRDLNLVRRRSFEDNGKASQPAPSRPPIHRAAACLVATRMRPGAVFAVARIMTAHTSPNGPDGRPGTDRSAPVLALVIRDGHPTEPPRHRRRVPPASAPQDHGALLRGLPEAQTRRDKPFSRMHAFLSDALRTPPGDRHLSDPRRIQRSHLGASPGPRAIVTMDATSVVHA
jgi:hypothetical protein